MTQPAARTMIDSAYPTAQDRAKPVRDIVLIYSGGDTVHPWTPAEIASMPERYRWPCFVRSNPQQCDPHVDAAAFIHWLTAHGVPKGTCVILDLETAVDAAYVDTFNLLLRTAGWRVTKYGSQGYVWQNPRTDGGTFVALPSPRFGGPAGSPGDGVLTTEGDTVARQWGFEGDYDLSVVKPQDELALWDARPPRPHQPLIVEHVTAGHASLSQLAHQHGETAKQVILDTVAHATAVQNEQFGSYLDAAAAAYAPHMPAGLHLWVRQP